MNNPNGVVGPGRRWGSLLWIGVWLMSATTPCLGQASVAASASSRYEYDSNVFDLQGGLPIPGTNDYRHADWLSTYGAALDLGYLWGRQRLFATLSDNEFRYDHFTPLNHNEYTLDTGLEWKMLRTLEGTFDLQRNRTMVAFTNVNNAEFDLQTEQREASKIDFTFTPDWRLEGSGYYRTVTQVFVDLPTLDLRESAGTVGIQYLGRAGLTAGLAGTYTAGVYTGSSAALNPSYTQRSLGLTGAYVPSGHSALNAVVGYSERSSASALNTISGFTGELDYNNQITGKTTVHLLASRAINSYVANVSSEIDSVAAASVNWQATYKLDVILGYSWTNRKLPGQGIEGPTSTRTDHLQYASLNLNYQPLWWLSIKPYLNYQTRKSNIVGGDFDASVVGVYAVVQWQNQAQPDLRIRHLNDPAGVH